MSQSTELSNSQSPSMNWNELITMSKEVKRFVSSLNASNIGGGRVLYDEEKCILSPRSWYFDNSYCQWLVNLFNSNAHFENTQNGFAEIRTKVQQIQRSIEQFNPQTKEDCPPEASKTLLRLIRTLQIIKEVSTKGLDRLCENYTRLGKTDCSVSLREYGDDIFSGIGEAQKKLCSHLTKYDPSLETVVLLRKFALSAADLLGNRFTSMANLSSANWNSQLGTTIPSELLNDCRRDFEEAKKTNPTAIRIAANHIELPHTVREIPVPLLHTTWKPLCPQSDENGNISFGEGVTGTCEGDKGAGICNVYYLVNPFDGSIVMSSGVIESPEKARQLVACIRKAEASQSSPSNTPRRYVLHSLSSLYNDDTFIFNMHNASRHAGDLLASTSTDKAPCLWHINTALNPASHQSSNEINMTALGEFAPVALADILELLREGNVSHESLDSVYSAVFADLLPTLSQACIEAKTAAQKIRNIKRAMTDLADGKADSTESLKPPSRQAEQEPSAEFAPLEEETLPKEPEALKKLLKQTQETLRSKLSEVIKAVKECIDCFKQLKITHTMNIHLEKADLISKVFRLLVGSQLGIKEMAPISRCTEIELFFLLYKLLNIAPIHTCRSGLDESSLSSAIHNAMTSIYQFFYAENEKLFFPPEHAQKLSLDQEKVKILIQVHAFRDLFQLVSKQDEYRTQIYDICNVVVSEEGLSNHILTDLSQYGTVQASSVDLRGKILEKIKSKEKPENARDFLTGSSETSSAEPLPLIDALSRGESEGLLYAMSYMELVGTHLFGEMIKTIYSTGVPSLNYHNNSWLFWAKTSLSANSHLAERMPMFIFPQGKQNETDSTTPPIQMLAFNRGWGLFSPSLNMTPIGLSLFNRTGGR